MGSQAETQPVLIRDDEGFNQGFGTVILTPWFNDSGLGVWDSRTMLVRYSTASRNGSKANMGGA